MTKYAIIPEPKKIIVGERGRNTANPKALQAENCISVVKSVATLLSISVHCVNFYLELEKRI